MIALVWRARVMLVVATTLLLVSSPMALERRDVTVKIFQFRADQIPRVDGKVDDWAIVPESYAVGMNELMDTEQGHGMNHDTKNLDVKVRVGWVKGLNRLYFLYEGFDNYCDLSGGPWRRDKSPPPARRMSFWRCFSASRRRRVTTD